MKYLDEHIDLYLMGEMSPSEQQEFESAMLQDRDLAAEVELMRGIIQGLKDRQEKQDLISKWQAESDHKKALSRRAWVPWVSAFSAAAMVVAGVFLFTPSPSDRLLPSAGEMGRHASPSDGEASFRGDNGYYSAIEDQIESGNYEAAETALENQIIEAESRLKENKKILDRADYEYRKNQYELKQLYILRDRIKKEMSKQK